MATRTAICRFDTASFRIDSVTGDLHAEVQPTKAGVFLYRDPKTGGIRRELRSREEVFKADSLVTLEGKPFTDGHPTTNGKRILLNAANVDQYKTGVVIGPHTVAADGLHTEARVLVTDKAHIERILAGKKAVSCGYRCDEDFTPGIDPEFGPYDMAQKNLDYNHLANEFRGRMGAGAELRMDSDEGARFDAEEIDPDEADQPETPAKVTDSTEKTHSTKEKPKRMATLKLDHGDFEIDNDLDIALKVKFAADKQKADDEKTRADAAEADLATEKARAERLDAELAAAKHDLEEFNAAKAKEVRDALEASAASVLGEGAKFDGLTDRQVQEMAIEKALPWALKEKPLAERADEWIGAMYAVATRTPEEPAGPSAAFKPVITAAVQKNGENSQRQDADPNDPVAARLQMLKEIQEAHKGA